MHGGAEADRRAGGRGRRPGRGALEGALRAPPLGRRAAARARPGGVVADATRPVRRLARIRRGHDLPRPGRGGGAAPAGFRLPAGGAVRADLGPGRDGRRPGDALGRDRGTRDRHRHRTDRALSRPPDRPRRALVDRRRRRRQRARRRAVRTRGLPPLREPHAGPDPVGAADLKELAPVTASLNPELTELSLEGLRLRRSAKWRFYDEDVLPAWVAEMDFPLAPAVKIALAEAVEMDDTGYGYPPKLGLAEAFVEF